MGIDEKNGVAVNNTEVDRLTPTTPTRETHRPEFNYANNGYAHAKRPAGVRILLLIIDVGLALSPLLFLGIAIAAIAYNRKPQDKRNFVDSLDYTTGQQIRQEATGLEKWYNTRGGNAVIAAAQIAVSIFPILFAAIIGRFLKSYAMYRAERGAQMGMLEQFYGSQSLANAVQLTYALGGASFWGVAVVVLWLLSPLGGQSVQRVLKKTTAFNQSAGNVYYTNTSATNGAFSNHFNAAMRVDSLNAILSTALLTDAVVTDNDAWGNVKIPSFESLDTSGYDPKSVAAGNETIYVPSGAYSSSMVGILVNNVTNATNTYFTAKTSYLDLTCEEPKVWDYSQVCLDLGYDNTTLAQLQPWNDFAAWTNLLSPIANATDPALVTNSSDPTAPSEPIWQSFKFNFGVQTNGSTVLTEGSYGVPTFANPPTFIFSTQDSCVITAYKCASRVAWVETDVYCQAGGVCTVYGMRNSTRPKEDEVDSIFDQRSNDNGHGFPLDMMLGTLGAFSSSGATGITNPLQWYLSGSPSPFHTNGQDAYVDWTKVSADLMSKKLSTLLNTFWMIGLQYGAISQPRSTNSTAILQSVTNSTSYDPNAGLGYDLTGAYADFETAKDIYAVNWAFVIIAIIISLMLITLGFIGIWLRHRNSNPDVLGYVSTLTRDNPNFEAPVDAHKSDGLEMANYYKKMKVQLVKSTEGEDRGRITLQPVQM